MDFQAHRERCRDISEAGNKLVSEGNHHADSINQRCQQLQTKLDHLQALASRRKAKLLDNSAYLQFMWKADVVESWIGDKESHVKNEEYGRDLSSVQTLLTKQDTFDAGEYGGVVLRFGLTDLNLPNERGAREVFLFFLSDCSWF